MNGQSVDCRLTQWTYIPRPWAGAGRLGLLLVHGAPWRVDNMQKIVVERMSIPSCGPYYQYVDSQVAGEIRRNLQIRNTVLVKIIFVSPQLYCFDCIVSPLILKILFRYAPVHLRSGCDVGVPGDNSQLANVIIICGWLFVIVQALLATKTTILILCRRRSIFGQLCLWRQTRS